MYKELPKNTTREHIRPYHSSGRISFPNNDIVFSRGRLPRKVVGIIELASSILFTASSSSRQKVLLEKATFDDEVLDRLTLVSIEHKFSIEEAKALERNDLIVWLRSHGLMQSEITVIFGISAGRISQIEKIKGAQIGVVFSSTDRLMRELDEIGQDRIDDLIKKIAENKEFWGGGSRRLKVRRVMKELGLPYGNSNLNARRLRYLENNYHFPKSKAELLFRVKFPHLRDFKKWLESMYLSHKMAAEEIAALIGTSPQTIASELVRVGIKIKPRYGIEKRQSENFKKLSINVPAVNNEKDAEPAAKLKDLPGERNEMSGQDKLRKVPAAKLRKAIGRLRGEEREILIDYLLMNFTIEEIAYLFDKKKSSIERLLHRAQSHLKKILESK